MYNAGVKEIFIQSSKYKLIAKSLFNKSEEYEIKYDCEACVLEKSVFEEIIKDIRANTHSYKYYLQKFIREYLDWCKNNGMVVNPDLYSIDVDFVIDSKDSYVYSEMHMNKVLDDIFGISSDMSSSLMNRCYLWCAFYGVDASDSDYIVEMCNDDVHEDDFTISVNGEIYEIGRYARNDFLLLKNSTEFNYDHKNYSTKRKRVVSNFLFRGTGVSNNYHISSVTIKTSTNKAVSKSGYSLTYKTVFMSGIFCRAFDMENAGFEVNFDSYCIGKYSKSKKPGHVIKSGTQEYVNIVRKRNSLKKDYEMWKGLLL